MEIINQNTIFKYTQVYDYLKSIKFDEYISNKRDIIHKQLYENSINKLIDEVNNENTTLIMFSKSVRFILYLPKVLAITSSLILFSALLISPKNIIYAYIFTSFIGYIANLLLYNHLICANVYCSIGKFILYTFPSIAVYIIIKYLIANSVSLMFQILIAFVLLLFVYLVVLQFYGMSVNKLIKWCIKR